MHTKKLRARHQLRCSWQRATRTEKKADEREKCDKLRIENPQSQSWSHCTTYVYIGACVVATSEWFRFDYQLHGKLAQWPNWSLNAAAARLCLYRFASYEGVFCIVRSSFLASFLILLMLFRLHLSSFCFISHLSNRLYVCHFDIISRPLSAWTNLAVGCFTFL